MVFSFTKWMVAGGKVWFRMSMDGYRLLFLGDDVMNESFEDADIRSGGLRSTYPVFPIGQSDHNLITFQFDGENIVPGDVSHMLVLLIIAEKAEFAEIERCLLIGHVDIVVYEPP
jgi:hypothetical protein